MSNQSPPRQSNPQPPPRSGPEAGHALPDLSLVPKALLVGKRFFPWRTELRQGQVTKVPYRTDARPPRGKVNVTNSADWSNLEDVLETLRSQPGLFSGVGRVFSSDEGLCGVDLDNARAEDGTLLPWAQEIVDRFDGGYVEISPSGTGIKLWCRGRWGKGRRTKIADGVGEIECYDRNRYFTLTGRRLDSGGDQIADCQEALDWLRRKYFTKAGETSKALQPPSESDEDIVQALSTDDHIGPIWRAEVPEDESRGDHALLCELLRRTGCGVARTETLFGISPRGQRPKWASRADYRERSVRAALEAVRNEPPPRRKVYVRDGDPLVLDEIAQAIAAGGKVFERLGRPVRVRGVENGEAEAAGLHRPTGAPVIEELTVPTLAESAICACHFVRLDRRSDGERDANAPSQYLQMLAANAEGRFPPLYGVIEAPTLSADGSLLARGGYDRASGLFLALEGTWPDIPATPTGSQVEGAVALLNEALFNFPFVDETHKSAAFALLFTLLARDLIPGPVPVFLIDATAPGTGKSLLGDLCSVIASGRPASRWAFVADEDEQRKRLISMALAGDRFVLLDNVEQPVGGSALAGAVTSASISDRRLGTNQTVTAQFRAVLAFTGNGLQLKGDLARRAVAIYLDAHEERPEERRNFRHPRLLDWATQHRPELAVAALTVLRGFLAAGRPSQNLPPFGSFEAWSETIRQALVWAGLPDPCQTRQRIRDDADPDGQAFGDLLRALHAHCGTRPVRVADLLKEVSACDSAEADGSLKEALGYYAERGQDLPSARRLAYVLRSKKGRIVSGLRLDSLMDRKRTTLWRVAPIGEERYAGDAGDAGDTSSPRARSVEDDYGTASETTPPGAGIIAGNDRHHRHLKAVLDTDSDREEVIGQAVLL